MSKEEIEKAKKRLNKKLENERELERTSSYSEIVDEIIKDNKSIETLLQYIDQLEQENETLKQCLIDNNTKDENEHLYLGNLNMEKGNMNSKEMKKENKWLRCIHLADRRDNNLCDAIKKVEQLEQENKKLNKMIDEMVKVMIASSICDYFIKDYCENYPGENHKLCDECIKEYFEKKVEG